MARLRSYHSKGLIEAGLDEVGRGCLAGPVVAAAVILRPNFRHPLLNDSKQLNEKSRNMLSDIIKEKALSFAIAEIDNREIDRINILQATFKAMHMAIDRLELIPEHLLIDGNRFLPYPFIPHTCVIKGDSKFKSIAAASILAKVHRDFLMKELHNDHPQYGWNRNVGYPTKAHRKGISEVGITEFHRKSFRLLPDTE
ncbi:MAG: ribonuclease HII [Flavobacteriales bacterium]|nr:ribonuclease HII [Flavobacteriales bacterium]NNK80628.1 ribonuclease HII [Flavobacteriales bacterium]